MTTNIETIKPANTIYDIEGTRDRQTLTEPNGFKAFTLATTDLLLTGTAIAAGAVGGPAAALAVAGAGGAIANGLAGGPAGAAGPIGAAGAGLDPLTQAQQMQAAGMASSFQLLALQQKVQDENRQFSTLSNVMRARHDTDKAAIGNIRS